MMSNENDAVSSYLTEEEVQNITQTVERAPDRYLTWPDVFAVRQIANPRAESDHFYVADEDEGSSRLLRKLSDAEKIFVSGQKVTYSVYRPGLGWELEMDDIETSRAHGAALDVTVVSRATRGVNEHLNAIAYVGDNEFGVPGILEASGVTTIAASGTIPLMTNVASEFIAMFNSLPVKFRNASPYKLVLPDATWKLLQKIGNTYNDKSIAAQITDAIPNLEIVQPEINLDAGTLLGDGSTVPVGIGLFIPKDVANVRLPLAQSPQTTIKAYEDDRVVKGKVYARAGPVEVVFPTSVGYITGLTS